MYYPSKPTKGQQFKLYFDTEGEVVIRNGDAIADMGRFPVEANIALSTITDANIKVSKDGGAFVQTTNAAVEITPGKCYVILTATEMNADVVIFSIIYNSGASSVNSQKCLKTIIIETTTGSSGISAADVWGYTNRTLTGSVAVNGDVSIDLNTVVPDINSISRTNPTLREVLSLLWFGMTQTSQKSGWSFNKWLKKFSW